jgi:hypothetical protein
MQSVHCRDHHGGAARAEAHGAELAGLPQEPRPRQPKAHSRGCHPPWCGDASLTPRYSNRLTALVPPLQRTKAPFRSPRGLLAMRRRWRRLSGPAGARGDGASPPGWRGAPAQPGVTAAAAVGAGQMAQNASHGGPFSPRRSWRHGQNPGRTRRPDTETRIAAKYSYSGSPYNLQPEKPLKARAIDRGNQPMGKPSRLGIVGEHSAPGCWRQHNGQQEAQPPVMP